MNVNEIAEAQRTPELDAARDEYAKIMTDVAHPMHADLKLGGAKSNAYINSLYSQALPKNAPVPIDTESVSLASDASEDAQAQAEIEQSLRVEFGDSYDTTMSAAASGAELLFSGDEGQRAFTAISHQVTGLGPKAEALGIKFLADFSKLQGER